MFGGYNVCVGRGACNVQHVDQVVRLPSGAVHQPLFCAYLQTVEPVGEGAPNGAFWACLILAQVSLNALYRTGLDRRAVYGVTAVSALR
jgi:hypothetical protein